MKIQYLLGLIILLGCKDTSNSRDSLVERDNNTINESESIEAKVSIKEIKNIEDIQQEYRYINSAYKKKAFDSTSFNYNCYNERKGTVTYFSDEDGLKIIQHSYNEYSHYSSIHRYYIKNERPFFIFYKDLSWKFDGEANGQPGTKDDITEKRYFLVENQIVKCMAKMYSKLSYSDNNPTPNEVPNKKVPCPSINKLNQSFEALLKNKNETTDVKCLEGYD